MGFDATELKELSESLKQYQQSWDVFCEDTVKELASKLLAKVIKRTPVGKAPTLKGPKTVKIKNVDGKGRARSFLTAEGARYARYWSGYKGGTLRRGWTIGNVTKIGDTFKIEVINPIIYASYVEFGHRQKPGRYIPALGVKLKKSWVEGKFMLTISESDLEREAPAIIERRIKQKLGEYFA